MLESIRKHSKFVMILLFLLIIPSFIFVGIDQSYFSGASPTVARVAGQDITQNDWDNTHRVESDRLRAENPGIDAKLLDSPEARYATLERMVRAECEASGCPAEPTFEYYAHGEVTDNDPGAHETVRECFDEVFGELSVTAQPATVSEDFCYLPQAWGVPYYFWFVGSTPDELLDNPPVNHQSTFLPDYAPTMESATRAAAASVLSFLAR